MFNQFPVWFVGSFIFVCQLFTLCQSSRTIFEVNLKNESVFGQPCVFRNSRVTFLYFQYTFWPLQGCTSKV